MGRHYSPSSPSDPWREMTHPASDRRLIIQGYRPTGRESRITRLKWYVQRNRRSITIGWWNDFRSLSRGTPVTRLPERVQASLARPGRTNEGRVRLFPSQTSYSSARHTLSSLAGIFMLTEILMFFSKRRNSAKCRTMCPSMLGWLRNSNLTTDSYFKSNLITFWLTLFHLQFITTLIRKCCWSVLWN